jgi:mycothiol system anti-sigma-R factor
VHEEHGEKAEVPNGKMTDEPEGSAPGTAGGPVSADAAAAWLGTGGFGCDEAVHQLYHYLDGELTEEKRQQITEHLDLCAPCAGAADFEAELRRVIANRCKDHVPDSLMQKIATAIDEEQRRHDEPV